MEHTPGFLKAVAEAQTSVREVSIEDVLAKRKRGESFYFVDCREDDEFHASRAQGAIHIGKGVIERDIERRIPDPSAEIVLYCGGGYRSVLAAAAIQKMGYKNVTSMKEGIRGWRARGLPEEA